VFDGEPTFFRSPQEFRDWLARPPNKAQIIAYLYQR
jgi:hypothetical protein